MRKLNNKGFSLIEIMIAIVLLGVLITMASSAYNSYKKKARQQAYDTMAKSVTTAAENYLMENVKTKYITFETLKELEYVDTFQDPRYKDNECSGIVINKVVPGETQKKLDVLFQKVKLCCKNYKYQYDYTGDDVQVTEIENCDYIEGDEIHGMYKLIYKSQGGSTCDPAIVLKEQGEEWGPLCVPTKGKSIFREWNTKSDGSGKTITETTTVGDKDISAYAIWTNIYTLKFDENGGTVCATPTIDRESGEEWGNLCETTRPGYVFKGWNTKKDGSGSTITKNSSASKNLTVYAQWNGEYTLTFNSNGGSNCNPGSITKESGEEWGTLCTPTRTGYEFKGWNTKKDGTGTKVTKNTKVSDSMIVYAKWTPVYTLTFDSNGGSKCNPATLSKESGEEWGELCAPTKTGYKFNGWKNGSTTITSTTKATSNITVTADWTAKTYKLTYDSNGGSACNPATVSKSYNQEWGTLCTPTKAGYTFTGWKNGSTTVTSTTKATSNITVEAGWSKQSYTLTYNSNGGSNCSPTTVTKEYNTAWGTLCKPTKTGYTFNGWKNGSTTVTSTTKATSNITVTADWTIKTYKLTYDSNGGSACSPATVSKTYNTAWGTLCTPTKTGSTFVGWKNGNTEVTSTTKATSNITVEAQWSTQSYTLTYDSAGGSACNLNKITKSYNTAWGTLCTPTKTGYTFNGWKNGSTTVTSTTKATSNITVTAQWTAKKYTLTYDSNGGSNCSPTTVTKSYNTAWGTLCTPTKSGYTFAGWKSGSTEITSTTKATSNITAKAQWSTQSYTLTYDSAGGSACNPNKITKSYNTTWGTLCTPTKTGYTFAGWKSGSKEITSTTKATSDITVKAQWSTQSYKLTYDSAGGSACSPATVTKSYNSEWGTLCTPTKTGYTFAGWKNGSTTITSTTKATSNITVTAQWTAIPQVTKSGTVYLYDAYNYNASAYSQAISCKTSSTSCTATSTIKYVSTRKGNLIFMPAKSFNLTSTGHALTYDWQFTKTNYVTDSDNGLWGRTEPTANSGERVNGLDIGHHFYPSMFAYDSGTACPNHIWAYGYSYEEGWYGWCCSYYLY